jgi:hypothetical protein
LATRLTLDQESLGSTPSRAAMNPVLKSIGFFYLIFIKQKGSKVSPAPLSNFIKLLFYFINPEGSGFQK